MAFFPGVLSCFSSSVPSSSSRVCDDAVNNKSKSSDKLGAKSKKKSSSAPIPVSYFPINSQFSRL
ncbi:hypothetical protein RND71_007585 [Anisodus tanguticus]|uniref:Uncharacterized protein n=1 Tax=Anisodus tanguticus TaxID=243964 RepID=A0AAE1SP30_9SOLA|nr:hypothetical protein RND71_007585 [Anisodus tanguticus]